jgi:uncharacterized protein (TIGR03067 family)
MQQTLRRGSRSEFVRTSEAMKSPPIGESRNSAIATVGGSNRAFTFEFAADGKLRSTMAGRLPTDELTDPTAKPATIDWATHAGDVVGIFKVEADTLTLCFCGKNGRRQPTEFASPVGGPVSLISFKWVETRD